jgi:hypothetical protein
LCSTLQSHADQDQDSTQKECSDTTKLVTSKGTERQGRQLSDILNGIEAVNPKSASSFGPRYNLLLEIAYIPNVPGEGLLK